MIKEEAISKNKYLSNIVNIVSGYGSEIGKIHYSFGIANGMRHCLLSSTKEKFFYSTVYNMTNTDIENGFGESNQFYARNNKTALY